MKTCVSLYSLVVLAFYMIQPCLSRGPFIQLNNRQPFMIRQIVSPEKDNRTAEKQYPPSLHQRLISQISSFTQNVFKDAQKAESNQEAENRQSQNFERLLGSLVDRRVPMEKVSNNSSANAVQVKNDAVSKHRLKNTQNSDEELDKMMRVGYSLLPAFERVRKKASRLSAIPERLDAQVTIGRARIAARRVTPVSDVDGNGFIDYIVANPSAQNHSGSIRLYLMTKGRKFLYTRDLVPGKHGFDAEPLKEGHQFGAAVTHLPGINGTGLFIAVSAPGDGIHGAVYVIKLSRSGDVLKHIKSRGMTRLERKVDHGNNSHDGQYAKVDILSDVSNIVFEAADGEVLATLTVDSKKDAHLLNMVEHDYLMPTLKLLSKQTENLSPQTGFGTKEVACLFNESFCACDTTDKDSSVSFQVSGIDQASGRTLCFKTAKLSTVCRCGGTKLCARSKRLEEFYVAEGKAVNKLVYCRKERMMQTELTVTSTQPADFLEQTETHSLDTYNATHCICARMRHDDNNCLKLKHESKGLAMFCSRDSCETSGQEFSCNVLGNAYCERETTRTAEWVFDGVVTQKQGLTYCHKEHKLSEKASLLFYLS